MLRAAVFMPMPNREMPVRDSNASDPPNDIATCWLLGCMPRPLSTTRMRNVLSRFPCTMYTRTSVAPHWNELSTSSHSADVVLLYPWSRSDLISVCPRNRGTLTSPLSIRFRTARPPRGAVSPHWANGSAVTAGGTSGVAF